jgi:hypothetical protein
MRNHENRKLRRIFRFLNQFHHGYAGEVIGGVASVLGVGLYSDVEASKMRVQ